MCGDAEEPCLAPPTVARVSVVGKGKADGRMKPQSQGGLARTGPWRTQ